MAKTCKRACAFDRGALRIFTPQRSSTCYIGRLYSPLSRQLAELEASRSFATRAEERGKGLLNFVIVGILNTRISQQECMNNNSARVTETCYQQGAEKTLELPRNRDKVLEGHTPWLSIVRLLGM